MHIVIASYNKYLIGLLLLEPLKIILVQYLDILRVFSDGIFELEIIIF